MLTFKGNSETKLIDRNELVVETEVNSWIYLVWQDVEIIIKYLHTNCNTSGL